MKNWFETFGLVLGALAASVGFAALVLELYQSSQWLVAASAGASLIAIIVTGLSSVYVARILKSAASSPRIFLSYSFAAKEDARKLRDALTRHGAKVWFDENALQPGDDLRAAIGSAIESSNSVVALISGQVGSHLSRELMAAKDRHVPVFAIIVGDEPVGDNQMLLRGAEVQRMKGELDLDAIVKAALKASYRVARTTKEEKPIV